MIKPAHHTASLPWGPHPVSPDGHTRPVTPLGCCPSGVTWAACEPQQSPAGAGRRPCPRGRRQATAGLAAGGWWLSWVSLGRHPPAPRSHYGPPCAHPGALGKRTSVRGVCTDLRAGTPLPWVPGLLPPPWESRTLSSASSQGRWWVARARAGVHGSGGGVWQPLPVLTSLGPPPIRPRCRPHCEYVPGG